VSNIDIDWQYTKCFDRLNSEREPIVILTGGAGSGKSYSMMQYIIIKFVTEQKKNFLVTRKTLPALRQTAYKWIVNLLKDAQIYQHCQHNKSERVIEFGSNYMLFTSVDDPEKIKSTDWNYIWMEEANEFLLEDFIQLNLRKRSPLEGADINQIFLTHNPTDEFGYINQELVQKRGIIPIHSTYKDNPFLPHDYVRELEQLEAQNEDYWKIYGLGEYAQLTNMVFKPWLVLSEYPAHFDETIYGVDFGYNNPSAIIQVNVLDGEPYTRELLYESHLTNADLIGRLKELDIKPYDYLYCDSEAPEKIEEIQRAGFYAIPAVKGKNSVKDGIDYMKRLRIFTCPGNVNLNKERSAYCWKTDNKGNITEEPIKHHDHALDALRYAIYSHMAQGVEQKIHFL
jgi:phage terminase large subunit